MDKITETRISELLGKPVFPEFSDRVEKMRRNLLLFSFIALGLSFGSLVIDPSSTLLGLKFQGLTTHSIHLGMLALNLYMLIHFLWCAWDSIIEWKLRVTGTREILKNTFGDESQDVTNDPRQSTLHNWWLERGKKFDNLTTKTDDTLRDLEEWMKKVPDYTDNNDASTRQVHQSELSTISHNLKKLSQDLRTEASTVNHLRLEVSLKRFDDWYKLFLRSQNLRWLLMELLLPIGLGIFTIIVLYNRVST